MASLRSCGSDWNSGTYSAVGCPHGRGLEWIRITYFTRVLLSVGSPGTSEPVAGVRHTLLAMAELLLFHHAEGLTPGVLAAEGLPEGLVYLGFSLGVLPAQMLAQTRAGARAAVLFHSCVPASEFGGWPPGVPLQ